MPNKYICPSSTYQSTYAHPVRHAIDVSGVEDLSKVVIPDRLKNFSQFLYNPSRKRLSFMTANLSYCVTGAKFFKDGQFYQKGEFFSVDPNVHLFNSIFVNANPNLKYYSNENKTNFNVRTYDFLDKGDEKAGAIYSINEIKKLFGELPDKLKAGSSILIFGVVGIILFKVFNKVK